MENDLSLGSTRVFIVEDEALILYTLQDMLEELGCRVVATALRIDDALAKGDSAAFDVAILDVNVGGEPIDPVADLLARRGVPFLFATGYGARSLPDGHRDRVVLTKPYRTQDVRAALDAVLPG
ncbi:MAG: response regulator [Reyranella sp.]|jgi:CheY-like chemotaxis protein|nr:response regulator [Reyranella sp.]MBL6654308.1 response regulator [Reyranella sp.]